jgi:ABC-type protease/lipase transport system fused ATPase/permease subunit
VVTSNSSTSLDTAPATAGAISNTQTGFSSSPALGALFDLPWTPVYLALRYAFHPLIC